MVNPNVFIQCKYVVKQQKRFLYSVSMMILTLNKVKRDIQPDHVEAHLEICYKFFMLLPILCLNLN